MQKLNLKQDQHRAQVLYMATKTELFTPKLIYYALQMPFRPAVAVTDEDHFVCVDGIENYNKKD